MRTVCQQTILKKYHAFGSNTLTFFNTILIWANISRYWCNYSLGSIQTIRTVARLHQRQVTFYEYKVLISIVQRRKVQAEYMYNRNVLFVGHGQTEQTQTSHHTMRRLIWVPTVCVYRILKATVM